MEGMMKRFLFGLIAFCAIGTSFGQQVVNQSDIPSACTSKCMAEFVQQSSHMDYSLTIPVPLDNATDMCPDISDVSGLDEYCQPAWKLKNCTSACPESTAKDIAVSTTAFQAPMFVCVDRIDDLKNNWACLSEKCPELQKTCISKCGSIEDATRKLASAVLRIRRAGATAANVTSPTSSAAQNQAVDTSEVTKAAGGVCLAVACILECSEELISKQCGKNAYIFQRDLLSRIISTLPQTVSSIGHHVHWPEQCQSISASANNVSASANVSTVAISTVSAGNDSTPEEEFFSTGEPSASFTSPASSPSSSNKGTKTKNNGKGKKCEKPPCQGSAVITPSTVLLLTAILMILSFRRS